MSSASSMSDLSSVSGGGGTSSKMEYHSLDFKIQIDCVKSGQETYVHLVAPTKQDKAAWITDISQVNFIKILTYNGSQQPTTKHPIFNDDTIQPQATPPRKKKLF